MPQVQEARTVRVNTATDNKPSAGASQRGIWLFMFDTNETAAVNSQADFQAGHLPKVRSKKCVLISGSVSCAGLEYYKMLITQGQIAGRAIAYQVLLSIMVNITDWDGNKKLIFMDWGALPQFSL